MRYKKYIVIAFVGALFLPLLSAKAENTNDENLNIKAITFIELESNESFDFDTSKYLPKGFNAYEDNFSVKSLNYMEDDTIDLGFDTAEYLPEEFNPYSN